MRRLLLLFVLAGAFPLGVPRCQAAVVASALGPTRDDDLNLIGFSFVDLPAGLSLTADGLAVDFTTSDDVFGYSRRSEAPGSLLDNSVPSTSDSLGLIKEADVDDFFGVSDTLNTDNGQPIVAQWEFSILGAGGGLQLAIDMAAMGDFEEGNPSSPSSDFYLFEISIDGGDFEPAFSSSVEEDVADVPYQLEDLESPPVELDDPLQMNGVRLDNDFQTLTHSLPGGGASLALRFTGHANGNQEVFAFRNVVIESGAETLLVGDYNEDGSVDAGDYALWRRWLGVSFDLPNRGVGIEGPVGPADYQAWRENYGAGAFGLATPVPSPSGGALIAAQAALILGWRRATRD